jgi:hypothetical protein
MVHLTPFHIAMLRHALLLPILCCAMFYLLAVQVMLLIDPAPARTMPA